MAAGIGMEAGQHEADLLSGTSVQVMEALINLLRVLASKREYSFSDVDDKGMKAITEHIRQGGKVRQSIVDRKDAKAFEHALKAYHIPFAQVAWNDTDGKEKRLYFTRDGAADGVRNALPSDVRLLEEAWKMYALSLREGLGEVTIHEFLKAAEGQAAVRLCGLSPEEREAFGRAMAGYSGSYAFADGEEGTTDVLYLKKDGEQIDKAFKDVCYAFSGEQGWDYRKQLRADLQVRDSFYESALPVGNETVFIVDAQKPNEFIAVTRDGFSTHSIQRSKQIGHEESCEDADGRIYRAHDSLMRCVEQLQKPVILPAEEFTLIKGFLKDGRAEAGDFSETREMFHKLQEILAERPYYRGITASPERLGASGEKQRELYAVHSMEDAAYAGMNSRQKEALTMALNRHREEAVIDPGYTERVMDMEYSQSIFRGKRTGVER